MLAQAITEVILVGLPGPTHNYGGLSADNVASSLNRGNVSNPRQAALQALELVKLLKSLGLQAGILPPQLRPHLPSLRGRFSGSPEELIARAAKEAPDLLEKLSSSSAMWTANAATVTPGIDNDDGQLHITPANLATNLHRRIEAADTHRVLAAMFKNVPQCTVHAPSDAARGLRDEGAANHMRLAPHHGARGLNVFIYGADGAASDPETARQTRSAFEAIAANHHIPAESALFIRQNPGVIREGVFHNDVIAVSNESVLLVHERAYDGGMASIAAIAESYAALHAGHALNRIVIRDGDLSVEEAVHTYFFNSQIVTLPGGGMAIIAPEETRALYAGKAARLLEYIVRDEGNPIEDLHFADLRQSMNNGGGPACLRLRVPMTMAQLAAIRQNVNVMADDALLADLERIINTHYMEALTPEDIADPKLYHQCRDMLAALSRVTKLPLLAE